MKVLFMGTPDFAAGILEAIIKSDHEVVAVVTQEDKAKGRSDKLIPPPVKETALKYGLPVLQPHDIRVIFFFIRILYARRKDVKTFPA